MAYDPNYFLDAGHAIVAFMLDTYDSAIKLERASGTMWSAELRLTMSDSRDTPARSVTFYGTGQETAKDAMLYVCVYAMKWIERTECQPMPLPPWLVE
jgi:hypothetical protein